MIDIDVLSTAAGLQEFDAATVAEYCQTDEARVVLVLDEHGDLFTKRRPRHQAQPGSPRYRVLHPDALERRISAFSATGGFAPWFTTDDVPGNPVAVNHPMTVNSPEPTGLDRITHERVTHEPTTPDPIASAQIARAQITSAHLTPAQIGSDRITPDPVRQNRGGPRGVGLPDPSDTVSEGPEGPGTGPRRPGEPSGPGRATGRPRPPRSASRPRRPERGDQPLPRLFPGGYTSGGYTSGGYAGGAQAEITAAPHPGNPTDTPARPGGSLRPARPSRPTPRHPAATFSPVTDGPGTRHASGPAPHRADPHVPAPAGRLPHRPGPQTHAPHERALHDPATPPTTARNQIRRNPAPWNRQPATDPYPTDSGADDFRSAPDRRARRPQAPWPDPSDPSAAQAPDRHQVHLPDGPEAPDRLEVIHSRDPQPDPRLNRAENALLACARENDPQTRHTLASAAMSTLSECVPNLPRDGELHTVELEPRLRFALTLATLTLIESTGQPIARKLLISAYDDATAAAVEFLPSRQAELISRFRMLASGRSADFRSA